jgi:hypothetical protein
MRYQLLATALSCGAAFASFTAKAQVGPYPDAAYNGGYVIEVLPNTTLDHPNPGCMIFNASQGAYGVGTHRWPNAGLCGLGNLAAHAADKQAVWDIAPIKHTDGRKAYVIRSRVNGQCLIRSNNGHDVAPRTYMWNHTNPQWCGWGSQDALIDNGQAAWILGDTPNESANENLVAGMSVLRHGPANLTFSSIGTGVRAGQAMVVVDHMFRLTRLPEQCTTNGAVGTNEVVRVCGVGDFSQPVRFESAGYLQLPIYSWSQGPAYWMDFGDMTEYAVVYQRDASKYCSRLRTGNFSDWRVPTRTELRALVAAFPSNGLRQFGWTTGYRGHQTTERYQRNNNWYFTSVRFYNAEEVEEHENGTSFPISCIR